MFPDSDSFLIGWVNVNIDKQISWLMFLFFSCYLFKHRLATDKAYCFTILLQVILSGLNLNLIYISPIFSFIESFLIYIASGEKRGCPILLYRQRMNSNIDRHTSVINYHWTLVLVTERIPIQIHARFPRARDEDPEKKQEKAKEPDHRLVFKAELNTFSTDPYHKPELWGFCKDFNVAQVPDLLEVIQKTLDGRSKFQIWGICQDFCVQFIHHVADHGTLTYLSQVFCLRVSSIFYLLYYLVYASLYWNGYSVAPFLLPDFVLSLILFNDFHEFRHEHVLPNSSGISGPWHNLLTSLFTLSFFLLWPRDLTILMSIACPIYLIIFLLSRFTLAVSRSGYRLPDIEPQQRI